jgi:hypothetical protein
LRTIGFPSAWPFERLRLAIDRNSLARYSKRTHGPCVHRPEAASFLGGPCGLSSPDFRHFSPPFRGTFQLSLALLLRYRSRDVFRIGSLCLPTPRVISNTRYSGYPQSPFFLPPRGLSPTVVRRSSRVRHGKRGSAEVHNPTSALGCPQSIRFVLYRFRSPLLTVSLLISSPPPTRMLYFGGFPVLVRTELALRSSD